MMLRDKRLRTKLGKHFRTDEKGGKSKVRYLQPFTTATTVSFICMTMTIQYCKSRLVKTHIIRTACSVKYLLPYEAIKE